MSSSSKKQLRKEQNAAALTERQRKEQQEAKKLKQMTTGFVVVLALVLVAAITVLSIRAYNNSGIREKSTVALTVNDHQLNSAEFGYFYYDAIYSFYNNLTSNYGNDAPAYAEVLYNLDFTKSLKEQFQDEENNVTWADYFLNQAEATAKNTYAMYDNAMASGYTLSEEDQKSLDAAINLLPSMADAAQYSSFKTYLKAMYGNGAAEESYKEYYKTSAIAALYSGDKNDSLIYTPDELRAYEGDRTAEYDAYSYHTYYLSRADYLTGGTKDEEGNTTYTDAEKEAAVKAAEADAKLLISKAVSLKALQTAIKELEVNAEKENPTTTAYTDDSYGTVTSHYREWVTNAERKAGDVTYTPNVTTTTNDDGSTTEQINGYYVVFYESVSDNTFPLANVRHILVGFEGGTKDSSGNTTYSDEEKAAAKKKADELLAQWSSGEATEDSFAALVKDNTTDAASAENGGLYTDVYPGQMVTNFNDWCFDETRKAGDTGIVESSSGYHLMYYVSDSETTYRDYVVGAEKRTEDMTDWTKGIVDAATITKGDWSLLNTSISFN